jgi:hypothetical protein
MIFFPDGPADKSRERLRLKFGIPILFLFIGSAMGFYYAGSNTAPGESGLAAINLLRNGVIGNPYLIPTGPTAHVSPLLVAYLAGVFSIFGNNTFLARAALSVFAAAAYAISSFLSLRSCQSDRTAILSAAAILVIFPVFLFSNCVTARQWDQPFSSLILMLAWTVLTLKPTSSAKPLSSMSLLTGFGTLLSPGILPSLLCATVAMSWQRRAVFPILKSGIVVSAVLIAFLVPWGIRNEVELGRFILTRSDFALEFATGNGVGADGSSGSGNALRYHPHDSKQAADEMARVGEARYMDEMAAVSRREVSERPGDFIRVTINRMLLTIVPSPRLTTWEPPFGIVAGYFMMVFGFLHAIALLIAFWIKRYRFLAVVFTVLPVAPYWLTHVNGRYLAITYFPATILIAWLIAHVRSEWSGARQRALP